MKKFPDKRLFTGGKRGAPLGSRKRKYACTGRFRVAWSNMLGRCYDSRTNNFKYYGGKGIRVYSAWHDFKSFKGSMFSSYVRHARANNNDTQLDRINPDGHYRKSNCRWVTQRENKVRALI